MRILLFFLFVSNLLFANLVQVQELYDKKEYLKAIEVAKSSVEDYPNPKLHILWAKSAKALGKYTEAMTAYERVIILDANNINIQEEILSIYIDTKRYELAINLLKNSELKARDITISKVESYRKKEHTLNTSLSLTSGYDTNYNIHHEDDVIVEGTATKEASIFHQAIASIDYTKEFSDNFYFHTAFNGYYKSVMKDNNYNVYLNTFEMALGYYTQKYNFYIPITYSNLFYLNADYLSIFSITPQFDYKIGNNLIWNIHTKVESRQFKTNQTRDDETIAIGMMLYYMKYNNYLLLDVNYQSFSSSGAEVYPDFTEKTSLTLFVDGGYYIQPQLQLQSSYKLSFGNYVDDIGSIEVPDAEIRSDTYHQFNLKLSKEFTQNISIYIENEYSINHSNFKSVDYDKNIFSIGINLIY